MQDKRLWMDDRQYIYFACAYALKKEYQKGYDLLEKRFGKAGSRRTYQKLFEYRKVLFYFRSQSQLKKYRDSW